MKKIKSYIKSLTVFDYVLVALIVLGILFFAALFFRKQSFLTIQIKVSDENITWNSPGTKDWFSSFFYTGMKEKNGLGKVQAEVLKVFSYNTKPNRKDVYLTLRLLGVYTKAINQYSYKGRPLLVGYPIKLQLDNINVEGVITSVGDLDKRTKINLIVDVSAWDDKQDPYTLTNFSDTTGVRPYIADAISKGSYIADNNGDEVIKVLDKKVSDARKLVTTASGGVLVQKNPLLKDLSLTLNVEATKIGDRYYLFDEIPILIGERLPLNFNNVSIFPDVTKITVNEK